MSDKCPTCGKTVYAMERVGAVGKNYHKQCLKCSTCGKVVRNGQFNDHGGQVYCNNCYESSFVDEETKQIVYDMENTYAKKVHGTAVNILGGPAPIPSKLAKVETNTASAPLSMSNNYYNEAPPTPAPPMKTISSALSNAIVQSGGKVQRSGGGGGAPPPNIQSSKSYTNIRKAPEYDLENSNPPPIIQRNQNQRPIGNGNSAPIPPARKVGGNTSRQMIDDDDEPPRSVPAPPRLVQNTPSGGPQKLKTSRSYENLRKANTDSDLPPPPSVSLPALPRGGPSKGAPPPLVKRKY